MSFSFETKQLDRISTCGTPETARTFKSVYSPGCTEKFPQSENLKLSGDR